MGWEHSWILWDLAASLLLILCIRKGVRQGFVRMVVSLACYLLSALAAQRYSTRLAEAIYHGSIETPLRLAVVRRLEEALAGGAGATGLSDALPGWMKALGAALSRPEVKEALNLGLGVERIADILVEQVLSATILQVLQGVVFLVVFTLVSWVIRRFARLFSGVYRIPVIGTANCILGGLLGILQGAVLLVLAGMAVQLLISLLGERPWMNPQVIDSTYIFRIFYGPAFLERIFGRISPLGP